MKNKKESTRFLFGNCHLNIEGHILTKNDQPIPLPKKSFLILSHFVKNAGKTIKKEDILYKFWDQNYVEESQINKQIYIIRKAIKHEKTGENYITTVPNVGYRFSEEVVETSEELTKEKVKKVKLTKSDEKSENNLPINTENKKSEDLANYFPHNVPNKIWGFVAMSLFTMAFLTSFYFFDVNQADEFDSLAVLPFKQLDGAQSDMIGIALSDAVTSKLANKRKVYVSPTGSIVKFPSSKQKDLALIGKKLGVESVITGTVQHNKGVVRVNVQLVDVKTTLPVWSDRVDVKFSTLFAFQDEVSDRLSSKILKKLGKSS